MPFAVSIAAAAMQDLVDAAFANMQSNGKRDSVTVDFATVSTWPEGAPPWIPPNTVAAESAGTMFDPSSTPPVVPWAITVSETLGTVSAAPAVVGTHQFISAGNLPDWLIRMIHVVGQLALRVGWQNLSRTADGKAASQPRWWPTCPPGSPN